MPSKTTRVRPFANPIDRLDQHRGVAARPSYRIPIACDFRRTGPDTCLRLNIDTWMAESKTSEAEERQGPSETSSQPSFQGCLAHPGPSNCEYLPTPASWSISAATPSGRRYDEGPDEPRGLAGVLIYRYMRAGCRWHLLISACSAFLDSWIRKHNIAMEYTDVSVVLFNYLLLHGHIHRPAADIAGTHSSRPCHYRRRYWYN